MRRLDRVADEDDALVFAPAAVRVVVDVERAYAEHDAAVFRNALADRPVPGVGGSVPGS